MWWGHHGWCFFPFGLLFVVLVFVVIRFCIFRNFNRCSSNAWHGDAEAILKRRLASGDINESEYNKLKELLK